MRDSDVGGGLCTRQLVVGDVGYVRIQDGRLTSRCMVIVSENR